MANIEHRTQNFFYLEFKYKNRTRSLLRNATRLYGENRAPSCVKWTLISSTNKPLMVQSVLIFRKTSILALFIVSPYFLFECAVAEKSIDGYFSMTKCFSVIRLLLELEVSF